jgi:enoyl-CoA hydratase/carnithine racemase
MTFKVVKMTETTLSPTDKIQVKLLNQTAQITINNPPANTWDIESLTGLKKVVEKLNTLPEIIAIVIHGQGNKFFSAGADLNQFAEGNKAKASDVADAFGDSFETLAKFNGITIAAINGYAMGGGLECALSCDMRIIEQQAQVALPEATVGLLPCAGGTQRLSWLIGEAWASKMILLGERMNAETALQTGLVIEVVETGQALEHALALAEKINKQSPDAVRACKRLLNQARESAIQAGLEAEHSEFVDLIGEKNQLEGTNSFLEKRKPTWSHH